MARYELKLPKMGEGIIEATITAWTKNIGDAIEEDETVLEVATDKVDSEVPSEVPGVLVEKMFEVNDVVKIGETIAIIETDTEIDQDDSMNIIENLELNKIIENTVTEHQTESDTEIQISSSNIRFYTPLVKSIAKTEGVTQAELDQIKGSGKEGRVTKDDILQYIADKKAGKVTTATTNVTQDSKSEKDINAPVNIPQPSGVKLDNGDEIIEMDRMRKLIAEHMVNSKRISPHVQSFVEADVTKIVNWRNRIKDEFLKREGEKITFTPIFIYFIVKAIKDYPMINVQLDGTKIIKKKGINIGLAVALPSGNLIVPVIKNADQLSLTGLTKTVNDLAKRARENKLKPDEITGGTYTVTNIGSFGNIAGTAIINQPQVAIMALGAIRKMPAVIETPEGDMIGIRQKMILSHSYDHRVVDGMLGGLFVKRVADYFENFNGEDLI